MTGSMIRPRFPGHLSPEVPSFASTHAFGSNGLQDLSSEFLTRDVRTFTSAFHDVNYAYNTTVISTREIHCGMGRMVLMILQILGFFLNFVLVEYQQALVLHVTLLHPRIPV